MGWIAAALGFGWGPTLLRRVLEPDGAPTDPVAAHALLARLDPQTLDGEARVDLIQAFEKVAAMLAGGQQLALAAVVDATTAGGWEGDAARHEVGAALRLAPCTAAQRTWVAKQLRDRFPATLAALRTGEIGYRQAASLVDGTADLQRELAARVEARLLPRMTQQTDAETRRAVRDAVLKVDPDDAAERARQAAAQRTIERQPLPDAMTGWWVTLPAGTERDLWATLTARARAVQAARRAAGLDETALGTLRVDCLVDDVLGAGTATRVTIDDHSVGPVADPFDPIDPFDPDAHDQDERDLAEHDLAVEDDQAGPDEQIARVLAALQVAPRLATPPTGSGGSGRRVPRCSCGGAQVAAVVVDLPTALGLADNPGHLPGYGAIPAPIARRMAADRDWVRWTVDPGTRHLLDRGATTYRPSDKLRAFITARDSHCGFPGCHQPAQACDCDHTIAFNRAGKTIRVNLGPLCRQHHNAKTHGGWRLRYDPKTSTRTWTSPLGKTYLTTATPILT
jgi:hypothetical protein